MVKVIFSADAKSAISFLVGPRISGGKYWFQKEYVFDTIYPYIAQPVNVSLSFDNFGIYSTWSPVEIVIFDLRKFNIIFTVALFLRFFEMLLL